MLSRVVLPADWVSPQSLEKAIVASGDLRASGVEDVVFHFPVGCKVVIDAGVQLLSLVNQLEYTGKKVTLDFEPAKTGAKGYLNRMGFFDHLAPSINVTPTHPAQSTAQMLHGSNGGLVEIARINKDVCDQRLPTRLTDTLMRVCGDRDDAARLEGAAWNIFTELISNIFNHSKTPLDGYAALQFYRRSAILTAAVSDSGLGIMQTLRPSLQKDFPQLTRLSDTDLLVEVFRQGLSRHGGDRGCGLKGSAAKAMKYNAELDVRLPNQRVVLTPTSGVYRPNKTRNYNKLPLLWGTHIVFRFQLK